MAKEKEHNILLERQEATLLGSLLSPYDPLKVLNLACGKGLHMEYAQFGVDENPNLIMEAINRYPDKDFTVASPNVTNFPNTSFDAVYCMELLHILEKEKALEVFGEVGRVLRPNGQFIFSVPSKSRSQAKGIVKYDMKEIKSYFPEGQWDFKSYYGLQCLPIMDIPKTVRHYFYNLDSFLCKNLSADYAMFMVVVMQKEGFAFY